jgi:hypothetical protein
MKLSTVLLYSTTDYRWLDLCLKNITKVSDEVIIPMCSHFFNGDPENQELLDKSIKIIKKYPSVKLYNFNWSPGQNTFYWEGVARILGTLEINKSNNWVLYLDTDEIIDPVMFQEWVNSKQYEQYDSIKLSNYWYFRDVKYQSTTYEDSIVLARKNVITDGVNTVINPDISRGREQCHEMLNVKKIRNVKGINGKPMIHHYSWVRTKEQMLQKVRTWGHNADKDWISLIEEEFSRPFNGKCFVNDYEFEII